MSALRPFPSMGTMDALPPGRVFAPEGVYTYDFMAC